MRSPTRTDRRDRHLRTRARSPDLQVVAGTNVTTTPEATRAPSAPQSRLGNRATEALLARLRARMAEPEPQTPAEPEPDDRLAAPETATETATEATTEAQTPPQPDTSASQMPEAPGPDATESPGTDTPTTEAEATEPAAPEPETAAEDTLTTPQYPQPDATAESTEPEQLTEAETAAAAPAATEAPTPTLPETVSDPAPDPMADPAAGAGGGVPGVEPLAPGPELQAWHARTVGAAQAIETPPQPASTTAPITARTQGTQLRAGRRPRRDAIATEAEAAVPEPPEPVEARPQPPPDPVPSANTLVENTADQRLTTVTLPNLVASPRGTQPLVPDPNARRPPPEPSPAENSPAPAAETATSTEPTPADTAATEAVTEAATAPVPDVPPGTAEGVGIEDTPLPDREPLPEGDRPGMAQILARLLQNPAEQARPILEGARDDAYPNRVLPRAYQGIGDDKLPELTTALTTSLNMIATDAGIAADTLQTAVETRRAEVEAAAATATSELETARTEEEETLTCESGEELAEVNAAEDAQMSRTTVAAATGEGSPQVIDARRDAQVRKINRRVGDIRFGYDRAKERRHAALDRARAVQDHAYDQTRIADITAIRAEAEAEAPENAFSTALAIGRIGNWADASKRTLAAEVTTLKTNATTQATGFSFATSDAGRTAAEQVRDWASTLKEEETTWWDRLWARFNDWSQQAEAQTEAWSEVRASEARDATVQNAGLLQQFIRTQGEAVDLEANAAFGTLSAEQQAVVRAYYAAPAGSRDSIGAVAAGLRFRMAAQQKPLLIDRLKAEVLRKPDAEWRQLGQIGAAQSSSFSATAISEQLYQAMFGGVTGWGTDEDQIYRNLSGLTAVQGKAVRATYAVRHGSNLDSDLASELDADNALIRARAALDGDPVVEAVGALNEAMAGLGTDEDTIMQVLRGKTAEQRALIVEEYRRRYGVDLNAALDSEMDDHDQERAEALLAGDTSRADAIAIDQAMHGGFLGWGTDEAQIEGVYADVRNDVSTQQVPDEQGGMRPMTQAEMEAEVTRRNAQVEASYDDRYGTPGDQESALRAAYRDELSGPDLDLANALADNNLVAADAARLERERQGFYTDDDVVNNVLETQYSRALDGLQRDSEWRGRRDALSCRAAEEGWDPYRLAVAERQLDREMEQAARAGAQEKMAALERTYDTNYPRWGSGGLQVLIAFNMSGTDQERARTLLDQGGYLTRAQRFDYATRGVGTDEAEVTRALTGATASEIAEVDQHRAERGQASVAQTIDTEMSGRDQFDSRMLAEGVPENADQEMDQSRRRAQWELDNSPVGGHQRDVLVRSLADMEAQHALINDPDADPFLRQRALDQFRLRARDVQAGVDSYRKDVDAWSDATATAAALVAAIIVTVATGGVAGAVLGALAAAVATMSVKTYMKGADYGTDEMALDAVVGIVDAAAAYATFGMGNALLRMAVAGQSARVARLGTTRLAGTLTKLAGSASRSQRMLAHGMSEAIEGAAGALPSALAGNMLNDKNWQGNPLTNILGGTLMETGMGALVSGGIGSFGGFRMPHVDPPTPRSGDILAHRGTPQDRLDAWRAHRADNPDARMGDFLRRYDDQIADRLQAEARDANVQRVLRTELFSGIPPRQRRLFKDVEIEVMSDADFRAFTRSDSGNAVTIIDNGRPKIIMRDGAPPHVLREEGLHLQQILDPELGPLARRLDESRLRDWDSLSIAEQMELYSIKVELEIDAQIRLIDGLDADIRAARPGTDLDALARQRDLAQESLTNLRRRADEVSAIGPMERIAMARGLRDPPPYLDQPARLFSKAKKPPVTPVELPSVPARRASIPRADGTLGVTGTITTRGSKKVLADTEAGKVGFEMEIGGQLWGFDVQNGQLMRFPVDTAGNKIGRRSAVPPETLIDGQIRIREVDPATGAVTLRTEPITFAVRGKKEIEINRDYFTSDTGPNAGVEEALAMGYSSFSPQQLGWMSSGSSINRQGAIGELASQTRARADARAGTGTTQAAIDVQQGGGTGFDGVELHLIGGVPVVRVVEVKNHADYVNYKEFTAVRRRYVQKGVATGEDNLQKNLDDLGRRLQASPDELAEARRRAAIEAEPPEPIGHGPLGPPPQDSSLDESFDFLFDDFAGGMSMAERALAAQADRQATSAATEAAEAAQRAARETRAQEIADQLAADRLGIRPAQLRQMRDAVSGNRIELEIRLGPNAELGGMSSNAGNTALVRLREDWAGFRPILAPTTLQPGDLERAARVFDGTRDLGFSPNILSTGRPDIPYVDINGNMLAVEEIAGAAGRADPETIARDIALNLRRWRSVPPLGSGFPSVAVDLSGATGNKAALIDQINAELDRLPTPLTAAERAKLTFWSN